MSQIETDEALATIASAVNENHDGLAAFTDKLKQTGELPSFWWDDHPIWVRPAPPLSPWPLDLLDGDSFALISPQGDHQYKLLGPTLRQACDDGLAPSLTVAEFTLFCDLAAGLSTEASAARASIARSTRRKQLQTLFRKLNVSSQAELVSLANRVLGQLAAQLDAQFKLHQSDWGAYRSYLPSGVRCGRIEGDHDRSVRYLEVGPPSGKPVIVLHPMLFPHIEPADIAQLAQLNLRTIWPIRTGCLEAQRVTSRDWSTHCAQTVSDLRTIHSMCSDAPVPLVALVSSGAYATRFALKHPDCVARIDYVSTCFSAGKSKSRDVYFGDFLLRSLRRNGRMALVAMQHLAGAAFKQDRLEPTMRRIFRGSPADQALIAEDFRSPERAARTTFALKHSVESMRQDYFAQLHFNWASARQLSVPLQFWHGAEDTVHDPADLKALAQSICDQDPQILPQMGHLTQGTALRTIFRQLAAAYLK
ncbi:MAG: alpha/beta hydrolase [Pseudomonadota bacterium]